MCDYPTKPWHFVEHIAVASFSNLDANTEKSPKMKRKKYRWGLRRFTNHSEERLEAIAHFGFFTTLGQTQMDVTKTARGQAQMNVRQALMYRHHVRDKCTCKRNVSSFCAYPRAVLLSKMPYCKIQRFDGSCALPRAVLLQSLQSKTTTATFHEIVLYFLGGGGKEGRKEKT